MEIKILCPCGVKFKFDVEPVNGASPGPVRCPGCGSDSTEAVNGQIGERLAGAMTRISVAAPAPVAVAAGGGGGPSVSIPAVRIPSPAIKVSAPVASVSVQAAPPPGAPASVGPKMPVMPVPTSGTALSVKPPGEAAEHAAPMASSESSNASGSSNAPGSPKMAFMPAPTEGGRSLSVAGAHGKPEAGPVAEGTFVAPTPVAAHPAAGKLPRSEAPESGGSFTLGMVGALVGALVGVILWYVVAVNVVPMRWFASLPGVVVGMGAMLLAKKGSEKLAMTAAIIAAASAIGMQFVIIGAINEKRITAAIEENYTDRMALAKRAGEAKTDDQVRELMIDDDETEFFAAKEIEAEDITKYRASKLASLQKFAKGEPSKSKFMETERTRVIDEEDYRKYRVGIISMVIWIGSGVTSAFQIGRGKEEK